jgi:predicted membrane channel-forming protein YqfA (hemolysin III family)
LLWYRWTELSAEYFSFYYGHLTSQPLKVIGQPYMDSAASHSESVSTFSFFKHKILKIGSVSFILHLMMNADPVTETLFEITHDGQ